MAKYGHIYLITNIINHKRYVGQTTRSVTQRFEEHSKADTYLGSAIRKYGRENFTISIIDTAHSDQELNLKEIHWIEEFRAFGTAGYNLTNGGEGTNTTKRVENELNEEQLKFVKKVQRLRKPNVGKPNEIIPSIALKLMELYLMAEFEADKKSSAKLIYRLKPNLFFQVLNLGVINKAELINWAIK